MGIPPRRQQLLPSRRLVARPPRTPRRARIFYLRRALRILPLYAVTLVVIFALVALGAPGSWQEFPAWIYGLFLTNFALAWAQHWDWLPLSVLWSLAVEEQFYLLAPWIVRALPRGWLPWFAGAVVLFAWLLRWLVLVWFPQGHFAVNVLTPLRMDELALGVLIAWAVRTTTTGQFLARLAKRWPLWLACAACGPVLLTFQRAAGGDRAFCLYGFSALAVFYALLVATVAGARPQILIRLLAWLPLVHLGRHSYFVYLWHPLIGVGVIRWLGGEAFALVSLPAAGVVALAVATTWAAAALSWRYFEGPLVAIGQSHPY
jgi:peptidoglycan/LPS O-acetylase OafA/YrhL